MAPNASDIITYSGVPLAVIGVLPTLYIFFRSLITLRDIRRILARNHVTAITRPSTLAGLVEIELPRLSLAPLDRNDVLYFSVNSARSELKGGSWTSVHWREMRVGTANYRVQYHDELRQPAADVDFESIVAFLLDRGAVPDPCGWADLKEAGMWTPAGTVLLRYPAGRGGRHGEPVLKTVTSEDSDGLLVLVMQWNVEWSGRSIDDLPPYWMRLKAPTDSKSLGFGHKDEDTKEQENDDEKTEAANSEDLEGKSMVKSNTDETLVAQKHLSVSSAKRASLSPSANPFLSADSTAYGHNRRHSASSFHSYQSHHSRRHSHGEYLTSLPSSTASLRLRLSPSGLSTLLTEPVQRPLHTPHVLSPNPIAPFFSAACSALAHLPTAEDAGGPLWSHTPPAYLLSLAHTPSIPLGVMSLLSFLPGDSWRSPDHLASQATALEMQQLAQRQKREEQMRAMMAESKLSPAERTKAWQQRIQREMTEERYAREKERLESTRQEELEVQEAVSSRRVSVGVVADACREWLVKEEFISAGEDISGLVERLLWECVRREEVANALGEMLAQWKAWVEAGGITRAGFEMMKEKKIEFCYAACLLSLIGETATSEAGSVGSDMQECLRLWKKVRLE